MHVVAEIADKGIDVLRRTTDGDAPGHRHRVHTFAHDIGRVRGEGVGGQRIDGGNGASAIRDQSIARQTKRGVRA